VDLEQYIPELKLAVVQMLVGADKQANINRAVSRIREAAQNGANLVVLPVGPNIYRFTISREIS